MNDVLINIINKITDVLSTDKIKDIDLEKLEILENEINDYDIDINTYRIDKYNQDGMCIGDTVKFKLYDMIIEGTLISYTEESITVLALKEIIVSTTRDNIVSISKSNTILPKWILKKSTNLSIQDRDKLIQYLKKEGKLC